MPHSRSKVNFQFIAESGFIVVVSAGLGETFKSAGLRYRMGVNARRGRFLLVAILLLSLFLRVGWGLVEQAEPDVRLGDQFEYLELGRNLLQARQLRFYDDRFEQWVYAYRTPGYPFLIAACGGNVRGCSPCPGAA